MDPSPEPFAAWQAWLLAGLFLVSFFFSGTETALTSLGEAKERQLRERLGAAGAPLDRWIHSPREVLAVLLVGNNLANIGASALATQVAIRAFGNAGVGVATGVMTLVVLIFGEITPKTLARDHAEAVSAWALRLLFPFYLAFFPLAWLLVRLAGIFSSGERRAPPVTSEEIDFMIGLGSEVGVLKGVKKDLLTSVLDFSDLLVKEIMVPRTQMVAIDLDSEDEEVLSVMAEREHSRIPVFENTIDAVVGVLYIKDLLPTLRPTARPAELDLRGLLRPAFFVPEVMKVTRLLQEMQSRRTHIAIVVDEFGGTSGLVTLEDVMEEIVGDIHDEHDVAERLIKVQPDGKLLVDAGISLRELEAILSVDFPEDGDYETLSGFLTDNAGQVPAVGAVVAFGGMVFTVLRAEPTRVELVEVERQQDSAADPSASGPVSPDPEPSQEVAAHV